MHRNAGLGLIGFLALTSVGANTPPVTLLSAGSTFIYPIFSRWCEEYAKMHPEVHVSYEALGSGQGIGRTLSGFADFGASDAPLSDAQVQQARTTIIEFPAVLGAVVPSYNLPGITQPVRFTPAALAGIYLGTITRWNDAELVKANPGIRLPAHALNVVYRTDGSGTTYIWTDYLSKVSESWRTRVGRGTSVVFPMGVGAQFNEGVRDLIKEKPYTLGYLELTYAVEGHLQTGLVQNVTGSFVGADSGTIAAAATGASMSSDFRLSITNAPTPDAYPISSFSWLLVPDRIEDPAKRLAITGFLRWVLVDGQKLASGLHYAPLPGNVANRVLKTVDRIH